ncbi:hypothetical protein HZA96_01710 [Candidatus Woesearchaeota archaeon]|nr:hypothetical protein [Candidatus Woesearchaeota archaeon]
MVELLEEALKLIDTELKDRTLDLTENQTEYNKDAILYQLRKDKYNQREIEGFPTYIPIVTSSRAE